jgi:protoporphyrinogen oxidase
MHHQTEQNNQSPKAIIIGAGPAGLTAAWELLTRTNIKPVILEKTKDTGGLSRTVNYKGNRMDIGGHRFFSKSDRVMQWWLDMMPLEAGTSEAFVINYQNRQTTVASNANSRRSQGDMMVRPRRSRIYFLKKFFPYPLTLSLKTLQKLGLIRTLRILVSYLHTRVFPPAEIKTLEQFFISRFGNELYQTFFKSYTEKVWGVPCSSLPASWGAQRIKDLSIRQTLAHLVKQWKPGKRDLAQKELSTSLIEQFLYPKYGPGHFWEQVANDILEKGGEIRYGEDVTAITHKGNRITSVTTHTENQENFTYEGDYYFSTMPVREFISGLYPKPASTELLKVAEGLVYRDFITIGILVNQFAKEALKQGPLNDNWIYIQDGGVQIGRLQIFNNWSPWMVAQTGTQWLGLEYFCNETDAFWHKPDEEIIQLGASELVKIGLIEKNAVIDGTVIRQQKTYPSYTGTYDQFEIVKNYLMGFENLYPIGRNGMHRYNNSDHSMLTAMMSVDHILKLVRDKKEIWDVNTEESYHEEKK